jgi:hypothetical protein
MDNATKIDRSIVEHNIFTNAVNQWKSIEKYPLIREEPDKEYVVR